MSPKAQELLEQLRALPPPERLRIVVQVMHEAQSAQAQPWSENYSATGLWADLDDEEFDAFTRAVQQLRESDELRTDE